MDTLAAGHAQQGGVAKRFSVIDASSAALGTSLGRPGRMQTCRQRPLLLGMVRAWFGLMLACGAACREDPLLADMGQFGAEASGGAARPYAPGPSVGSESSQEEQPATRGALQVVLQAPPEIRHANSRTSVLVDLVVRAQDGTALSASDFSVVLLQAAAGRRLTLDDALDAESWLSVSQRETSSNLNFQLVLDASFSMTQHKPPAFEPMKMAAADVIEEVRAVWQERGGTVFTGLLWFDEWIYHAEGDWGRAQIMGIETPPAGTPTRLLGAVHYMASYMRSQYDQGVAAGPRDKHVMLVFTDGKDNISMLDSTPPPLSEPCQGFCSADTEAECQDGTLAPPCPNKTDAGFCSQEGGATAAFRSFGYPCVDLAAIEKVFAEHPNLVTHVVGLGTDVSRGELTSIAEAGGGVAVFGTESGAIRKLFDEVLEEFVNIQTYGAHIPQPRGRYRFGLLVTAEDSTGTSLVAAARTGTLCTFEYTTDDGFIAGSLEGEHCKL